MIKSTKALTFFMFLLSFTSSQQAQQEPKELRFEWVAEEKTKLLPEKKQVKNRVLNAFKNSIGSNKYLRCINLLFGSYCTSLFLKQSYTHRKTISNFGLASAIPLTFAFTAIWNGLICLTFDTTFFVGDKMFEWQKTNADKIKSDGAKVALTLSTLIICICIFLKLAQADHKIVEFIINKGAGFASKHDCLLDGDFKTAFANLSAFIRARAA